jgi:hypothetical protein
MKGLRQALTAAALLDATLGLLLLLGPQSVAQVLGILSYQENSMRFIGLLLLMLAGVGGYAAHNPFRYVGNVIVVIAGRAAGAVLLLLCCLAPNAPALYLAAGLLQLSLASLQAWLSRDLWRGVTRR